MTGVLALQGDFEAHRRALRNIGEDSLEVRTPEVLGSCDRLILPGGESTTLGILLRLSGLDTAITERIRDGMPAWGTCMGMILLANEIEDSDQYRMGVLDVTIKRNAFGAQMFSFEQGIPMKGLDQPVHAIFIRAPIVTRCGGGVQPIAEVEGKIVAVRAGRILGTSFHPELTGDTRLHSYFIDL